MPSVGEPHHHPHHRKRATPLDIFFGLPHLLSVVLRHLVCLDLDGTDTGARTLLLHAPLVCRQWRSVCKNEVECKLSLRWANDYFVQGHWSINQSLAPLLQRFNRLRDYDFRNCTNVTNNGLQQALLCCPHLHTLTLARCDSVTTEGFEMIPDCCPEIVTLDLSCVLSHVPNSCFAGFLTKLGKGCIALRSLNLSVWDTISDGGRLPAEAVIHFPELIQLNFSHCYELTGAGLSKCIADCPKLSRLDLSYCYCVAGDIAADAIADACPMLTFLKLEDCELMSTPHTIQKLVSRCSKLEHLDVSGIICPAMGKINNAVLDEMTNIQASPKILCLFGYLSIQSRWLVKK
jgi:hypothetical protein